MTRRAPAVSAVLRIALAVAMALSWLLAAGTPASAFVTRERVEAPKADAKLKRATDVIVAVEVIGAEEVRVDTRLFYGGTPPPPDPEETPTEGAGEQPDPELKPVSKRVLALAPFGKPTENEDGPGQVLRFKGTIDPYALAWMKQPAIAPNGQYTLEFRAVGSESPEREWQRYEFRLDAPPPPTSAPGIAVADPEQKRLSIAWQAYAVPDLSHYTVERSRDGGEWFVAAAEVDPAQTQIDDTVRTYGSYRYRVTAVRPAGDGSDETRTAVSPVSQPVQVQAAGDPAPEPNSVDDGDSPTTSDGTGDDDSGSGSAGSGTTAPPPLPSSGSSNTNPSLSSQSSGVPGVAAPENFVDTYKGPLDYGVEQQEVTERVPVDIAEGGADSDSTLKVLDRAIDQSRVLPPVAGGLILVVSAAHVLRYLNE